MFVARKQETVLEAKTRAFNAPNTIFTMGQVRQRNGVKPPETPVLVVKYVVRNQTDIVELRNGVKIQKI